MIHVSQRLFINLILHRAYRIFAKSTSSNFQFTLLFESRIGNVPKTLLWVIWAKYNTHVTVN
jgi:hypothetical protein